MMDEDDEGTHELPGEAEHVEGDEEAWQHSRMDEHEHRSTAPPASDDENDDIGGQPTLPPTSATRSHTSRSHPTSLTTTTKEHVDTTLYLFRYDSPYCDTCKC